MIERARALFPTFVMIERHLLTEFARHQLTIIRRAYHVIRFGGPDA